MHIVLDDTAVAASVSNPTRPLGPLCRKGSRGFRRDCGAVGSRVGVPPSGSRL